MILITGATGNVGRELVKLMARREAPIRVLVRDRSRAESIAYPGVGIVEGDLSKPETLESALTGIHKVFLLCPSGKNMVELEAALIAAADKAPDVEHVVKLSALGAAADSPARFLRAHAEAERILAQTDLPFTILRPNHFMQNFLNYRQPIIHRGEFYAPMGDGRISIVDTRDIAAVAAEVLTHNGHQGKTYIITGPESLTFAEMAERLSFEVGKPIAYVDIPPETLRDSLLHNGVDPWMADGVLELYASWKFNSAAEVTDTVHHEGKKDPITFEEFAHDYAPQFGRTKTRDALGEVMDTLTLDNMTPGS